MFPQSLSAARTADRIRAVYMARAAAMAFFDECCPDGLQGVADNFLAVFALACTRSGGEPMTAEPNRIWLPGLDGEEDLRLHFALVYSFGRGIENVRLALLLDKEEHSARVLEHEFWPPALTLAIENSFQPAGPRRMH